MSERLRYLVLDDVMAEHGRVASEEWIALHKRADAPPPDAEHGRRRRFALDRARTMVRRLSRRPVAGPRSVTASAGLAED